jgi:hypothetical protein
VYAEFSIAHSTLNRDVLKSQLVERFREDNRDALKESPFFGSGKWDDVVLYVTQTPSYRMMCLPQHDEELQVYVEPVTGNVLQACQSAWRGTKNALKNFKPTISSLKLVDNESGKDFMSATTGLRTEFKRRETLSPIIVGIAAGLYAVIGVLTFASSDSLKFLSGAVTGVVGALVAVILAVVEAKGGALRWK